MMKLLTRLLWLLCFLLIGGHAHTRQSNGYRSPRQVFEQTAHALAYAHHDKLLLDKAGNPGKRNEYERVKAEELEEDDDDTESFRKFSTGSESYFHYYYARPPGNGGPTHPNNLPSREHLSYLSPAKFILHRVIRI